MPYRYTGRANPLLLEEGGKPYRAGDMVPIAKERALNLVRTSNLHQFEGLDDPEDAPPTPAPVAREPKEDAAKK